jgi:hypothetical protein
MTCCLTLTPSSTAAWDIESSLAVKVGPLTLTMWRKADSFVKLSFTDSWFRLGGRVSQGAYLGTRACTYKGFAGSAWNWLG